MYKLSWGGSETSIKISQHQSGTGSFVLIITIHIITQILLRHRYATSIAIRSCSCLVLDSVLVAEWADIHVEHVLMPHHGRKVISPTQTSLVCYWTACDGAILTTEPTVCIAVWSAPLHNYFSVLAAEVLLSHYQKAFSENTYSKQPRF